MVTPGAAPNPDKDKSAIVDSQDAPLHLAPYYSGSEMYEFLTHGTKKLKFL